MTSRRSILVAMMAAPVAITVPAIAASPSNHAWDAALTAYERTAAAHLAAANAHTEADEFFDHNAPKQPSGRLALLKDGRTFTPDEAVANFNAEHEAWRLEVESFRAECKLDELEAAYHDAARAEKKALDALLESEAPDLAAVARKIELASEYGCSAWELEPVIADLRRIGGAA